MSDARNAVDNQMDANNVDNCRINEQSNIVELWFGNENDHEIKIGN